MQGGRVLRIAGILLALGTFMVCARFFRAPEPEYGFTFSSVYAESLGLDAGEVFRGAIDDLRPAFVRLPVYWNRVAPNSEEYDWRELDAQVAYATLRGIPVHMAVGAKVPRWPECFIPAWVNTDDTFAYRDALLVHMRKTVDRYADVIDVWQIENEPTFAFGECPRPDLALVRQEVRIVREQDPTARVQMTVSGEQQLWTSFISLADRVGVSMYRTVSESHIGTFSMPLSPGWYAFMRATVFGTRDVVVSELQLEPWFATDPRSIPLADSAELFTVRDAERVLAFARATRISEISMWGVEWWYYLRVHGYGALWGFFASR